MYMMHANMAGLAARQATGDPCPATSEWWGLNPSHLQFHAHPPHLYP